jgi:hypothetical protein
VAIAHHWIHLTKEESIECKNNYPVDSCSEFQDRMNQETKFVRNLSLRKDKGEGKNIKIQRRY